MKNKTVYHNIGYLMAESLGLISETRMTAIKLKTTGGAPLTPEAAMRARRATERKDAKLKANNKKSMGKAMDRDRAMLRSRAGASGHETSTD